MSLRKYAEVSAPERAVEVIDAFVVPANVGEKRLARMRRRAHRHQFEYSPRPGYIYVRSRAISSRCNDNFDEFPASEIKAAYRTFIGKPVFVNHHNADHRRARGVIIDAALHEDTNPDATEDTWAEVLMEVDAVKFPVLAREVLAGNIARTSMGTDVEYSECTACGNKAVTPADYCQHIPKMKGMKIRRAALHPDGTVAGTEEVLIAERCYGLRFFENSLLVEDPADPTAFSWVDHDASGGISASAAKAVINEAETVVAKANVIQRQRLASLQPTASTSDRVTDLSPGDQIMWGRPEIGTRSLVNGEVVAIDGDKVKIKGDDRTGYEAWVSDVELANGDWIIRAEGSAVEALLHQHTAYGETKAPAKVDTMRAENCPVCGDDEGYSGDKCSVCGYMQPPSQFTDPDLSKARETDLRQEQGDGVLPGEPGAEGDLKCDQCGETFSAEGDEPTEADPEVEADPADPNAAPDATSQKDDPSDLSALEDVDDDETFPEDDTDEANPVDKAVEDKVDEEIDDKVDDKALDETADDPFADDDLEDEEVEDPIDSTTDPAVGEGRITAEPEASTETTLDTPAAAGQTCPVCGQGTLSPVATTVATDGKEPPLNEVGTPPTKQQPVASRRGVSKEESRDMNQPNPAQKRRSAIIAAIREQQGDITALKRSLATSQANNILLRDAVATLAVAAGVGTHPKFAGIVRSAGLKVRADADTNNGDSIGGTPATTTQEAAKPDATDDVESIGAAPAPANTGVTPDAVTDVNDSNVAANPAVLDHLQDVTAPVSGTDAVTPAAGDAAGTSTVTVGTPDQKAFGEGDSGWKTSARGEDMERFMASQRLARLRISAGLVDSTDDISLAQTIASGRETLGEITAQVNALSAVRAKSAQAAPRHLVPRAAQRTDGVQPTRQPSLQATAAEVTAGSRAGEDEWLVDGIDLA